TPNKSLDSFAVFICSHSPSDLIDADNSARSSFSASGLTVGTLPRKILCRFWHYCALWVALRLIIRAHSHEFMSCSFAPPPHRSVADSLRRKFLISRFFTPFP